MHIVYKYIKCIRVGYKFPLQILQICYNNIEWLRGIEKSEYHGKEVSKLGWMTWKLYQGDIKTCNKNYSMDSLKLETKT